MSDLKTIRQQCKDFAKKHLAECCAEIMEWQDTAVLRDGKVRELAAMAGGFIGNHDTLRVAESFISRAAIEAATAAPTDLVAHLTAQLKEYKANYAQAIDSVAQLQDEVLKASEAVPTDSMPEETLTTMLWLYRRLPRSYGRQQLVESTIVALAKRAGEDVGEFLDERDDDRKSSET